MAGAEATTTTPQSVAAAPADAASQAQSAKQPQALNHNASQFLVPSPQAAIASMPIDGGCITAAVPPIPTQPIDPKEFVGKSMSDLHQMALNERNLLIAISRAGQEVIRTRLMMIFAEMARRYEVGESFNGLTGNKAMGAYLRSIGCAPGKLRVWKFQLRKEETAALASEIVPPAKSRKKTNAEVVTVSETEADLIAKAGVRMAQMLAGDGMTPVQERVSKAGAMAKDILEAIADGHYARLEPLPLSENAPTPQTATYADWKNHHLPASKYKLKYFEEASRNFWARFDYAFQGSAFKKILGMLKDKPEQVLSNAHDFAQTAVVLRAAADNLNLLAAAIATGLTPPPEPEPEPVREREPESDAATEPPPAKKDAPETLAAAQPEVASTGVKPAEARVAANKKTGQRVAKKSGEQATPKDAQEAAPCSKVVHEAFPGGPKVLEVAIPDEFEGDPPRLKYYVCAGEQKTPHDTLDAAKAEADRIAECHREAQRKERLSITDDVELVSASSAHRGYTDKWTTLK